MNKISAVYKIVNKVTGDCYIGSSRDVKCRWANHKCLGLWKKQPNNPLYQDFQKFGLDKFDFQILCPVMPEYLRQVEQELIEMLQPAYNNRYAKGLNVERFREYRQSEKAKEYQKKYHNEYRQSDKGREAKRVSNKKRNGRLCLYNGDTLTFCALVHRFSRAGIEHPSIEAKKYLL